MHENGIGVAQDFHLAKRYYDQALSTNPDCYLPVTLALLKLRIRSIYNTLTMGSVNGIDVKGGDEQDLAANRDTIELLRFNNLWRVVWHQWFAQVPIGNDVETARPPPEDDQLDSYSDVVWDEYEEQGEGIAQGALIIALCALIAGLVWYRNNHPIRELEQGEGQQERDREVLPGREGDLPLGQWIGGAAI